MGPWEGSRLRFGVSEYGQMMNMGTVAAIQPKREFQAVAGITIIAAVLRFFRLGAWSFTGDEIRTMVWLQNRVPMKDYGWSITKYLARAAIHWLGPTEFAARLVPATIGILSIPIVFVFVRKYWGKHVALYTSLLLATSPWHVYFSQTARFYTSQLLLYSLAIFLFIDGLRRNQFRTIAAALGLWGLALTEQLSALVFLPTVAVFLIYTIHSRSTSCGAFRVWPWLVLFSILLLVLTILGFPYIRDSEQFVAEFGPYLERTNNSVFLAGCAAYYVGVPTVVVGFAAALYLLVTGQRRGVLLATAAVLPVVLVSIGGSFYWLGCRHQFVSLVFWLVLASIGVRAIWEHTRNAAKILRTAPMLMILAVSAANLGMYSFVQNGNRANAKAAFNYISLHAGDADQIFVPQTQLAEYYLGRPAEQLNASMNMSGDWDSCRVWFIEDQYSSDRYPNVFQWVRNNTRLVVVEDVQVSAQLYTMRVYLYQRDC
jgi:4-amino-4-deoxy-L-arabinose transferase-like glycosyltransferase